MGLDMSDIVWRLERAYSMLFAINDALLYGQTEGPAYADGVYGVAEYIDDTRKMLEILNERKCAACMKCKFSTTPSSERSGPP